MPKLYAHNVAQSFKFLIVCKWSQRSIHMDRKQNWRYSTYISKYTLYTDHSQEHCKVHCKMLFDVLVCDSLQCKDYCYTNLMETIGNIVTGGKSQQKEKTKPSPWMWFLARGLLGKQIKNAENQTMLCLQC